MSFSARDEHGRDLPDTEVFVDGSLTAQRLDEGRAYDVDPGRHSIRFVHRGKEVFQDAVVVEGERGRNLSVTFNPDESAPRSTPSGPAISRAEVRQTERSSLPIVTVVGGGLVFATGVTLAAIGLFTFPSDCTFHTHDCSAPPGDKSFNDAHRSVSLMNAGTVTAVAGAAVGVVGLVWYLSGSTSNRERTYMQAVQLASGRFDF